MEGKREERQLKKIKTIIKGHEIRNDREKRRKS